MTESPSSRLRVERLEDRATPAALGVNWESFAADRVLVLMAEGADEPKAVARLAAHPHAAGVERLGFGTYRVDLAPKVSLAAALRELDAVRGVAHAEPDYAVRVAATPNDPSYGSLWGLNNANDADIDAPEAWDVARGTGGKIVAVIDTGVDYTHPDLAANMWRNPGETAGDGIDNDGNGIVDDVFGADYANNDGNPMDDHSHGTHAAGTIGAVGNNGVGVIGVAWTTRIMALKFLTASGSGSTSNAIRCIDYAITNGADILNNSWGGSGYSTSLFAAIHRARDAGAIFVAAAGNNGRDTDATPYYPAGYAVDNVLAVAATDSNDNLAGFSNYGATTVDLGAPGNSILSTMPGGGYGYKSGTSMAAPHVAGAIAVFWDQNPDLSYQEVISRLLGSVDPKASLAGRTVTGGRLNLKNLMDTGIVPPSSPPVRRLFGLPKLSEPIPDQSAVEVQVKVSPVAFPAGFTVSDLNVGLTIDHPHASDLIVTITSPGGTTVTLFDRRGGAGADLTATTFDDQAATAVSAAAAPFAGTFRPEQPLGAFAGENPAGYWTLRVRDAAKGEAGTLRAVFLDVTASAG